MTSGCTACTAIVQMLDKNRGYVYVGNAGDSRAVIAICEGDEGKLKA